MFPAPEDQMFFLVPEGPNVYSYQINQRFGLQRSPMLPHDIALLWSAITHWAKTINIWPRCGRNTKNQLVPNLHYTFKTLRVTRVNSRDPQGEFI